MTGSHVENAAGTELLDRLRQHPPSTWPSPLMRAVAAMIDVNFGVSEVEKPVAPVLQIVRRGRIEKL
jgi:hypothetical protein